jgi:hypothetical protein
MRMIKPGPFDPISLPNLNMTPRSYSFNIRTALAKNMKIKTAKTTIGNMVHPPLLLYNFLRLLKNPHKERLKNPHEGLTVSFSPFPLPQLKGEQ